VRTETVRQTGGQTDW